MVGFRGQVGRLLEGRLAGWQAGRQAGYEFPMYALKWLQDFGGASTRHWHTSSLAFFWMGLPVDEDSSSESTGDSWERLLDELQGETLLKDLVDQRALEASSLEDAAALDGEVVHVFSQQSKRRGQKQRRRMQLRRRPRAQGASCPPLAKKMKNLG